MRAEIRFDTIDIWFILIGSCGCKETGDQQSRKESRVGSIWYLKKNERKKEIKNENDRPLRSYFVLAIRVARTNSSQTIPMET